MASKITAWRLRRMVIHILLGLAIIFLTIKYGNIKWYLVYTLGAGIILSLLSMRYKVPGIYYLLKKFEKPYYFHRFPGKNALFFIAGCLAVLKLFPTELALASIAILTFADPVAYLVGSFGVIKYKKPFNRLKNVEGTIAAIIIAFFAANYFMHSPVKSLIAAVAAMITEAFIIRLGDDIIDDNFFIPLVSGAILYILPRFGIQ